MIIFILWLAVTCVTSVRPLAAECENDLPVIGILSQTLNEDGYPDSANYIASSYVKFVEMFAAQVAINLSLAMSTSKFKKNKTSDPFSKSLIPVLVAK